MVQLLTVVTRPDSGWSELLQSTSEQLRGSSNQQQLLLRVIACHCLASSLVIQYNGSTLQST